MKVIFLDIDGVLNNNDYYERRSKGLINNKHDIDELLISRVNDIVEATNAVIVVSSTWRLGGLSKVNNELINSGL